MKFEVQLEGASGTVKRIVDLERQGEAYRVLVDGELVDADAVEVAPHTISILLNGQSFEVHVAPSHDGKLQLQTGPHEYSAAVQDPRAWRGRKQGALEAEGKQQIISPMPGKVIRILVAAGDAVQAGQGIVVVEAMKMQNEIRSTKSGKVERVVAKEGQNVRAGEVLAWVE